MAIHFLNGIIAILESKETSLVGLAKEAGHDPTYFYIGADLTNVDIRGQDLSSLNLSGAQIKDAIIDEGTIINPKYTPIDWNLNTFKTAELSPKVYKYLRGMVESKEAKSLTQAMRILVKTSGILGLGFLERVELRDYLFKDSSHTKALLYPRKGRTNMTIKVNAWEHHFVMRFGAVLRVRSGGYNGAALLAMDKRSGQNPLEICGISEGQDSMIDDESLPLFESQDF